MIHAPSSWCGPFGQVRVSVLAISDQIKPDGGFAPESRMLLMMNTHLVVALLRVIVGIFFLSLVTCMSNGARHTLSNLVGISEGGPVLSRWGGPPTPRPDRELLLLPYLPITSLSLAVVISYISKSIRSPLNSSISCWLRTLFVPTTVHFGITDLVTTARAPIVTSLAI